MAPIIQPVNEPTDDQAPDQADSLFSRRFIQPMHDGAAESTVWVLLGASPGVQPSVHSAGAWRSGRLVHEGRPHRL